jgi:hypothetical protein
MKLTFSAVKGRDKQRLDRKYGKSVQISRHKYKFCWCVGLHADGAGINGLCDPEARILYVDVSGFDFESTIMHETYHAELIEGGFRQRTNWDYDLEEQIVETLANAVTHNYALKKKGKK